MGTSISVTCRSCKYTQEFQLGVGFMFYSLQAVLDCVRSKKVRQEIQTLLNEHKIREETFSMDVFCCDKCNGLHNHLFVDLFYDDGQKYEAVYKCPKCRKPMRKIDIHCHSGEWPCPGCGNKFLEVVEKIMWD